ncbi:hypothetical protein CASFOL_036718 [Castilleja foliolosa]|uniref:F-box associated beta-propeller type 1 domain-containing protein n=1 Tax=Castilleja foliolosa TaxID=1961234 RepID=A0ABD3BNU7_9LAMI
MPAISKFRCVSKSWINIIDSSSFAKLHLRNYCNIPTSSSSSKNDYNCVLIHNFDYPTKILKISMMLAGCHRLCREFSLDSDFGRDCQSDKFIEIVGPVNGLICIYEISPTDRFTLCNPYLGETKALPRAPRKMMSDGYLVFHRVGLGFDPVHKDIKVVQLLCYSWDIDEGKFTIGMLVSVYSRNTNIWTISKDKVNINMLVAEPIMIRDNDGSFCHWVEFRDQDGGGSAYIVLSFDVCNEVFYTTLLPHCASDMSKVGVKVFGKGGSLVLFSWTLHGQLIGEGGNFLDMWVLSGLGKEGCWTWQSGIGPLLHLSKPVGLWKSRGLVLDYVEEKRFVIYDFVTHEITSMDIDVGDECKPKVVEFKGSLVSLHK